MVKNAFFSDEKDRPLFHTGKGILYFALGLQSRIKEKHYKYLHQSRSRTGTFNV